MRETLLELVLWLIALYHFLMGLGAVLSERVAEQLAEKAFGIRLRLEPQTSYMVKLLGVYAAIFGVVVGVAATNPGRYPVLLDVVVGLYVLRILNKVGHRKLFSEAFDAPERRVWIDLAMLAAFGGAVLLLKP